MADERLEGVLTTLTEKLAKNGMEASATYKSDAQGNPILRVKALPILPLYAPMESFVFTYRWLSNGDLNGQIACENFLKCSLSLSRGDILDFINNCNLRCRYGTFTLNESGTMISYNYSATIANQYDNETFVKIFLCMYNDAGAIFREIMAFSDDSIGPDFTDY